MKPNKKQLLQFTLEEIIKFDIDNKAELMREILSEKMPKVLNVEATQPKKRYKCLICGRDKFTQKTSHYCIGGYRKRHLQWEEFTELQPDKTEVKSELRQLFEKIIDKI